MTCTCGTGFCFICGKEADGEDDHWVRSGGCPRYNQPGDRDEEYDDYGYGDENEYEDTDPLDDIHGLFEEDASLEPAADQPLFPGTAPSQEPAGGVLSGGSPSGQQTIDPTGNALSESLAQLLQGTLNEPAASLGNSEPGDTVAPAADEAESTFRITEAEYTPSRAPALPRSGHETLADMIAEAEHDTNFGGVSVTKDEVDDNMALWEIFAALERERTVRQAATQNRTA